MSAEVLMTVLAAALVGFALASSLIRLRLGSPPAALMRTNVNGKEVPAVLGEGVAATGLATLAAVSVAGALGWDPARTGRTGAAVALVVAVMGVAGGWDDRRGDETSRGFRGHLAALARGRVTGGALKIVAGLCAGGGAALLLGGGGPARAAATILLVAGAANTVNLFDRAPGRAGKVVLLGALPLMALGDVTWAAATAGLVGASIASLPVDLAEEAMLGDTGANPLGGAIGLGLAISLDGWGLWAAVVAVVALNVASERWSFSRIIATVSWLDAMDRAGRK